MLKINLTNPVPGFIIRIIQKAFETLKLEGCQTRKTFYHAV